ncbi:MAG: hypothetical protein K2O78_08325 [Muribaculaceae bacterium]|nr:hypothetical protein [Muribaculaceae bacterium]
MKRIKETAVVMATVVSLMVACGGAETLNLTQTAIGLICMVAIPKTAIIKGWMAPYDKDRSEK